MTRTKAKGGAGKEPPQPGPAQAAPRASPAGKAARPPPHGANGAARKAAAPPPPAPAPAGPEPRIDRVAARIGWFQLRRSKVFWLAIAVSCIPLAAGILAAVSDEADARNAREDDIDGFQMGYGELWTALVLYSCLPLAALLLAGGLVADEVEDRTLSYLLVRPVRRKTLYMSRLLPVAGMVAALGAFQALSVGLARLLALAMVNPGDLTVTATDLAGEPTDTVPTGAAILLATAGGMLASAGAGAAFAAIFGLVSLLLPRFHFIANLLVVAALEVPFSLLGGFGLGALTVSYHASSLVAAADLDVSGHGVAAQAPWWLAILALAGLTLLWAWVGGRRMRSADFHVTSAAN